MPSLLNDLPPDRANRLFLHPIHQAAFRTTVDLIAALRRCRTYRDYSAFQEDLLRQVLEVQQHRNACRRVSIRLRAGKAIPEDAPVLRSDEDPSDPDSWALEAQVCERVDRQYRSLGDALAWRVFSYDRRVIIAFSRNQPPGPMVGKVGLTAEREFVSSWSDDEDSFVLMHDLTSCLRIGDATLFRSVGHQYEAYLYEIKTDPSRKKGKQVRRNKLAEEAIRDNGPLPGDPQARFVELKTHYKTHLKILRDGFELARDRGVQGMRVPDGRALVAADIQRGYQLWPEDEFIVKTEMAFDLACARANITDTPYMVGARSDDRVARSPTQPPWAIYPLPPVVCAGLIFDMEFFAAGISRAQLTDILRRAGFRTQWVAVENQQQMQPGQVVLRIFNSSHGIELRESEIDRLALELVDLPTWVEGIREMFSRADLNGHPWPCFSHESKVWA